MFDAMPTPAADGFSIPNLAELELVDFWFASDPSARLRGAFVVSPGEGALNTFVVYLEVDPGNRIPLHAHSAEETVIVLQGAGEATVGTHQVEVRPGAVVVVSAFARHGFTSAGPDTLELVGFFGGSVVNYFDEPVMPLGVKSFSNPSLE